MKNISLEKAFWITHPDQKPGGTIDKQWPPFHSREVHIIPNDETLCVRKKFTLDESPISAYVCVTALGIFDITVNGSRVGTVENGETVYDELKPGWTNYSKRVLSFAYDMTSLLKKGENTIAITVSTGWWNGRISRCLYGFKKNAAIAAASITLSSGREIEINTDPSWEALLGGCVRYADIYNGEYYDATVSDITTASEGFNIKNAEIFDGFTGVISPAEAPFIRVRKELERSPYSAVVYRGSIDNGSDYGEINIIKSAVGKDCERLSLKKGDSLVLDFMQNLVGRPSISVKAARGTKLEFFCAEFLNDSGLRSRGNDGPKGSAYIENYRSAMSRVVYVAAGEDAFERYYPKFSFYGFRYLELVCDGDVEIEYVKAEVIGSENREISTFECSNEEINRLYSNVLWGQRGNYLSIPTDCPQRDERLGWTGDTQVFCGAAAYNADVNGFFKKWLLDIRDSQTADGSIFDVIPASTWGRYDNASWSDAILIVPLKIYQFFGDREMLKEHYPSLVKFMERLALYPLGERPNDYADWLAYEETSKGYISFATYANDLDLMSRIAATLSENEGDMYDLDAKKYRALFEDVKKKFNEKYVENGDLTERTQCTYLLALRFGLVDGELRENCIRALERKIIDNGYKLSTGFVGTGMLCQTLSEVGLDSLAYSLLMQSENPSWLYSLRQGATTVWERWNSYTLENGFGDVGMNSFNHYAYGAVFEWVFESVVGIARDPNVPAFKHFFIAPRPDMRSDSEIPEGQSRMTFARATYDSASGLIRCAWDMGGTGLTVKASVPEGTCATVKLPLACVKDRITVNAVETAYEKLDSFAVFELSAGDYVIKL